MWHQRFNHNFITLREYLLCTKNKKTKIKTLFNNSSPAIYHLPPLWRVLRCMHVLFSACKQGAVHACFTSEAKIIIVEPLMSQSHGLFLTAFLCLDRGSTLSVYGGSWSSWISLWRNPIVYVILCGSVVEHCVSSTKGCGFDSQGTHVLMKMYNLNAIVSRFG